jgi:hypothetical protein
VELHDQTPDLTIRDVKLFLREPYVGTFGQTAYVYGTGAILTFGTLTGGSGYTNGTYTNVRLSGGSGIDCFVTITVSGGAVTGVALQGSIWGGAGYTVGNSLTTSNIYLGGAGSGFSILVGSINTTSTAVSNAVNNVISVTMSNYYTSNYVAGVSGNQYVGGGGVNPFGGGNMNQCGTYLIRGATYSLKIIDCSFVVPAGADPSAFIPVVCTLGEDWAPGTITSGSNAINTTNTLVGGSGYVNGKYTNVPLTGGAGSQASANITVAGGAVTVVTIIGSGANYAVGNTLSAANANLGGSGSGFTVNVASIGASLRNPTTMAIPTNCVFQNIIFDGYCMGWVGACINCEFIDCKAFRYSEFQNSAANDPLGNMIGLVGTWTAPPHWFYIAPDSYFNSNVVIKQACDFGQYVGTLVHRSTTSGLITSLKVPPQYGTLVDGYTSYRPEGIAQFTTIGNANAKIQNMYGTYSSTSSFLTKPGDAGGGSQALVFPGSNSLVNVSLQADVTDVAPVPIGFPIGSDSNSAHTGTTLDLDVTTQDFPAAAYSVTNYAGITTTATYNTGYPGFGFGGNGNIIKARVKFQNFTNTAQTFRGVIANQGSTASLNTFWDVTISGWRLFTGTSIDGTRPRILITGANGANTNVVRQNDVANLMVTEIKGAKKTDSWTQQRLFTPAAGATYATSIVIPNSFSVIDVVFLNSATPPAGPTSMSLGDSSSATRLIASMAVTANADPYMPKAAAIPLVNSPTTLLLTANGSNFTGTGTIFLSVEAQRSWVSPE